MKPTRTLVRPAPTGARAKLKRLRKADADDVVGQSEKQWTREVFKLSRIHSGKPLETVESFVREWHENTLPRLIPGLNKSFAETWARFRKGRKRVEHPWGEAMEPVVRRARAAKYPPDVEQYDDERLRLLVKVCRELQRDEDHLWRRWRTGKIALCRGPHQSQREGQRCRKLHRPESWKRQPHFFLTSRAAEHYVGVSRTTAADWLDMLADDGVLSLVAKGDWKSRKGSTFKYRGRL